MIKTTKISSETLALGLILIIGVLLRFYQCAAFSFCNDELSALSRAHYNNFKDLIHYGVKLNDMHPAGTQTFIYYWIKIFGDTETSVRFPFIVAGILSILFSYLVAAKWFNKITGLFVAASLAFLQFPLLYSQIARPYSFGLLFTLISIWFWTKLLFDSNQKKYLNVIGYSLATSLITYTHHYAFLFALIVGITGLFFIKKETAKGYLLSVLIIFLLYIPHIPIFLYQFGIGGVGGWLGKPKSDWLEKFIQYCFNDSQIVLYTFCFIFLLTLLLGFRKRLNKFQLIAAIWFLLPYFIGYYYSIYQNPILQVSILLFSFPFLLIFSFSFVNPEFNLLNKIILALFSLILLWSTVLEKDYYHQQHFPEFKGLAKTTIKWVDLYGDANITKTFNLISPYYLNYYFHKLNSPIVIFSHRYGEPEGLDSLKTIIDNSQTPYFIYGWSSVYDPAEAEDFIRSKYGIIVSRDTFINSGITLYKIGEPKVLFKATHDFEKIHQWENDSILRSKKISRSGKYSSKYNESREFGPTFKLPLAKITSARSAKIRASVWVYAPDNTINAHLVVDIQQKGLPVLWRSSQLKRYLKEKNKWTKLFIICSLPISQNIEDQIGIYVWNPDKRTFYLDDFEIEVIDN